MKAAWPFVLCLIPGVSHAQEHEPTAEHFHRNHVAIVLGATTPLDNESNSTAFTVGADYERLFTRVVGARLAVDFTGRNHSRNGLIALELVVRPIPPLALLAGPGLEFVEKEETHNGATSTERETETVFRVGGSYDFAVGPLTIGPIAILDFLGETKTNFVFGISTGIGF